MSDDLRPERAEVPVRPVRAGDEDAWARLFAGYRAFYGLPRDDAVLTRVWSWVTDPALECSALVAEAPKALDVEGDAGVGAGPRVVGIAHYRPFARPSTGTVGLWLDDLYTDPGCRGVGVGRALLTGVRRLAHERGASVVRWITAEDNTRAHVLYDAVADRTRWVTYDAAPDGGA